MENKTFLLEKTIDPKSLICLDHTQYKHQLRTLSIIYLSTGGLIFFLSNVLNILTILFFIINKKAKKSPFAIYCFFLALFNFLKQLKYLFNLLIKIKIIQYNGPVQFQSAKNNDLMCRWTHFLPNFSGHICIYIVILLQFQRYITLNTNSRYNLFIYNHAFTYFLCATLIFIFFIFDEFYLFENFFVFSTYCPFTFISNCIPNSNFKILNFIKFDTLFYHHYHTIIYNIIPFVLINLVNIFVVLAIRKRNSRKEMDIKTIVRKSTINIAQQSLNNDSTTSRGSNVLECSAPNRIVNRQSSVISNIIPLSVKLPKNELLIARLKGIFLFMPEITYTSIIVSTIQVLLTYPENIITYFDDSKTELFQNFKYTNGYKSTDFENKTFTKKFANVQILLLISNLLEIFDFSFYLGYQYLSCNSLNKEFKRFIFVDIFRSSEYEKNRKRTNTSISLDSVKRGTKV